MIQILTAAIYFLNNDFGGSFESAFVKSSRILFSTVDSLSLKCKILQVSGLNNINHNELVMLTQVMIISRLLSVTIFHTFKSLNHKLKVQLFININVCSSSVEY